MSFDDYQRLIWVRFSFSYYKIGVFGKGFHKAFATCKFAFCHKNKITHMHSAFGVPRVNWLLVGLDRILNKRHSLNKLRVNLKLYCNK